MKERERHTSGVTCWVDTDQPDPESATEFYAGVFGWEFEDTMPADEPGHYFVGRLRGLDVAAIGSLPGEATSQPVWNTYVRVDSASEAPTGRRAGGAVRLWEARGHRGALVVNDLSSWSLMGLAAPDRETARGLHRSFYGWEADPAGDCIFFGGAPPSWSVTFTVDDVEAATAQAFELGGTVVVPPFDAPPMRTAVLEDPAGAVFSISTYTPSSA